MLKNLTIKEIPYDERPYEKLETLGPSALSNAELLAIIIKTGSKEEKVTDLTTRLLASTENGLLDLYSKTIKDLMSIKGIGRVKAIQLKAVAEISKRMSKETYKRQLNINSPQSVANLYMEDMRHLSKEHMMMVLLDTKNSVIKEELVSIGTVNASLIHPREVFIYALKGHAVSFILIHNHPSGNPTPSPEDIAVTKRIKEASEIMGINILDHIIIGDGHYISLKEQGYL